ncbi:MAG: hypothetical protein NDI73_01110 [Desulfuromonadales bacterium]|nr:hypothetical protein [Desulfuromonadales bacterium]
MSRGWLLHIQLLLLLFAVGPAWAGDATIFTLWPLVDYRSAEDSSYRSLHLLGPLIKIESKDDEVEYAVRPLFYRAADDSGGSQTEILYPLAVERSQADTGFFDTFHLLHYDFGSREGGSSNQFYLFPFLFYGEDAEQGRYAAVFPVGGLLYDWFGRDRISFALFPLYARTNKGTTETKHLLWPFFSRTTGEDESGFAVWPLYGQSRKDGVYRKQFFLWPLCFNEDTGLDSGQPTTRFAVLPFWFEQESRDYSQRTVLWPFLSWTQDRAKEYEQWDAPWPLVRITRGTTRNGLRLLPFYADETIEARRKRWFLYPVYQIEDTNTEFLARQRHRVMFFLYSDLLERNLDTGAEKRRIDFWPLFGYHRENGVSRLNVLALLEPFFPENDALERSWSPLWRLYQQRWDAQGNQVVSILWNLYWQERQGEKLAMELFPLFDYRRDLTETRLRLFKGLATLRSEPEQRCLSLLFLPWEMCWAKQPGSPAIAAVIETAEAQP